MTVNIKKKTLISIELIPIEAMLYQERFSCIVLKLKVDINSNNFNSILPKFIICQPQKF